MDPIVEYVGILSTFSILLPILFCFMAIMKKAEGHLQLFSFFLLFGFFIDLAGWVSYKASLEGFILSPVGWLYQIYPIVEASFFFWIIGRFSNRNATQSMCEYSIWLTVPFWLVIKYIVGDQVFIGEVVVDVFPATYRIICSFLATLTILELIEIGQMKLLQSFSFWVLAAILFYCFSTFLILFLGKEVGQKLWYLHNTLNIITYLIYSTGFIVYRKNSQ